MEVLYPRSAGLAVHILRDGVEYHDLGGRYFVGRDKPN